MNKETDSSSLNKLDDIHSRFLKYYSIAIKKDNEELFRSLDEWNYLQNLVYSKKEIPKTVVWTFCVTYLCSIVIFQPEYSWVATVLILFLPFIGAFIYGIINVPDNIENKLYRRNQIKFAQHHETAPEIIHDVLLKRLGIEIESISYYDHITNTIGGYYVNDG